MSEIESIKIRIDQLESRVAELSEYVESIDPSKFEADYFFDYAKEIAERKGKVSISYLQTRLFINFSKACEVIDLLEEKGIIGPRLEGNPWREVLK